MWLKTFEPSSYYDEACMQLIKIGSRGRLIGADRTAFIKQAGAWFEHQVSKLDTHPDEPLIHLLAMGATEWTGPNRNGDGFKEATCKKYHDTFVKHARFFRDHINRNQKISYGMVKLSAYNDRMHRIELICGLNGSPERAKINDGLLADREMEKLAKGEDVPVSMSCSLPFDQCSHCGNKAKSRKEYCDSPRNGGHCKAGGLKNNMGALLEDGTVLHADNPNPKFFDISHVWRPADRIAYVSGYINKAAAAGRVITPDILVDETGFVLPDYALVPSGYTSSVEKQLKIAAMLYQHEQSPENRLDVAAFSAENTDLEKISSVPQKSFSAAMRSMVDSQILLSPEAFLKVTAGLSTKQAADTGLLLRARLPGIFAELVHDVDLHEKLAENPYIPAPSASPTWQRWASNLVEDFGMSKAACCRRQRLAAIRNISTKPVEVGMIKLAAAPALDELANQYALYQIAFFDSVSNNLSDLNLTAHYAIMQNRL